MDNPLLTNQKFDFKNLIVTIGAGGIAGISIESALYPLTSTITRIQASTKKVDYSS
jgi:hypothetical protein